MTSDNMLNKISLDFCSTFEKLLESKFKLQASLSLGFINLAKARYMMGISSITSLQYNLNDLNFAQHHVNVLTNLPNETIQFIKSEEDCLDFNKDFNNIVRRRKNQEICSTNKESSYIPIDENFHTIKLKQVSDKENKLIDMSSLNIDDNSQIDGIISDMKDNLDHLKSNIFVDSQDRINNTIVVKDTLKWFGVLVPEPLRKSQKIFTNSIDLILEISTLQARLEQLKKEYLNLLEN